jgi:hypothetical protein
MLNILDPIINAQTLKEIIQEEKQAYNFETNAERKKQRENRIKEATELNKKYLSILN